LTSKAGLTHIRSCLAIFYKKLSKKKYQEVCTQLQIKEEYPTPDNLDGIHALSGLKLHMMALVCGYESCTVIMAL